MCGCGCALATAPCINAIAFRAAGQKLGAALHAEPRKLKVHAAGCLALDRWQGEERVQLRLIDVAPAGCRNVSGRDR